VSGYAKVLPRLRSSLFACALLVSLSIWLLAIRAPLRLDETGSFWQISSGFSGIWPRQFISLSFPAYSYILWLCSHIFGTSEIALRIPSVLAMCAAAAALYVIAREIFSQEIAAISVVLFCLNPTVIFEAIDVRPYAFAVFTSNLAILAMLRLRRSESWWLAVPTGVASALPIYFHHLFGVILPAIWMLFLVLRTTTFKSTLKDLLLALASFTLALLPLLPGLRYLFHTAGSHVYETPPEFSRLFWTVAPGWLLPTFLVAGTFALVLRRGARTELSSPAKHDALFCFALGLVPLLILFSVSEWTTLHLFASRHCLVAAPGISLCWGWAVSRLRSAGVRLLFSCLFVGVSAFSYFTLSAARQHETPWKYALEFVEREASADHAPVLICSGFIESNSLPMPADAPAASFVLAPLSYYHLSVPVIALPEGLNAEAIRVASVFETRHAQTGGRFLAMGAESSYATLDWLSAAFGKRYTVKTLRVIDGFRIVEFVPIRNKFPAGAPTKSSGKAEE
jgi:4-amino-4-deoxy-L-arabinose transferase-like glycosyltransferase